MEKGRGVWERPWRRREEQGRGASDGGVKMSRDQGGSSRRGRGETRKGGDRGAANGGGNSPWMARGWQGGAACAVARRDSRRRASRGRAAATTDELDRRGRAVATTSTGGDEQQRRLTGGDEQQGGARPAGRANGRRDRGILGGLSKCARGRAPSGKFSSARTRGDFFVPPLAHPPSRAIRPLPRRLVAAGRLDAHLGPKRRDGLRLASNRA